MQTRKRRVVSAVIAGVGTVLACPSIAGACDPVTFCVSWELDLADQEYGDFVIDTSAPARGARVMIVPPPPEGAISGYLDEDGCISFSTAYTAGFKVVTYNDAVIDGVRVRAFPSEDAMTAETDFAWVTDVQGVAPGDVVPVLVEFDGDELPTMLAVATEVVHRIEELSDPGLPGPALLNVVRRTGFNAELGGASFIRIGVDAFREKFIFGHEIGHWYQAQYGGTTEWSRFYDYEPLEAPCVFAAVNDGSSAHGIRSAEANSGAMTEGFGHFIAAVAFNNITQEDGSFRYYKDVNQFEYPFYADLVNGDYEISLAGGTLPGTLGGVSQWVETWCQQDWDWPLNPGTQDQEISSEIDWLRFFWQFVASQDPALGQQASVSDVIDLITFARLSSHNWSSFVVWPQLLGAVQDPASGVSDRAARFEDLGPVNGVYNEGP